MLGAGMERTCCGRTRGFFPWSEDHVEAEGAHLMGAQSRLDLTLGESKIPRDMAGFRVVFPMFLDPEDSRMMGCAPALLLQSKPCSSGRRSPQSAKAASTIVLGIWFAIPPIPPSVC